jgi:hypothetical protein
MLASERECAHREERRIREEEARSEQTADKERIRDLESNIEIVSTKHRAILKGFLLGGIWRYLAN